VNSERLRHVPSDDANRLFFTLWTSKEAYVKARGTGFVTRLGSIRGRARPGRDRGAEYAGWMKAASPRNCLIRILSLGPDHAGAVAAEVKIGKFIYRCYGDVCLAVRGACRVLESNRRTALQIVEIAPFVGLEHVDPGRDRPSAAGIVRWPAFQAARRLASSASLTST
jgi:hypothetical protein